MTDDPGARNPEDAPPAPDPPAASGPPPGPEDDRARALAAWRGWRPGEGEGEPRPRPKTVEAFDELLRAADEEIARGGRDLGPRPRREEVHGRGSEPGSSRRVSEDEAARALAAWKHWNKMPPSLRDTMEAPRITQDEAIQALAAAWSSRHGSRGAEPSLEDLLDESAEIPVHRIEEDALEAPDAAAALVVRPGSAAPAPAPGGAADLQSRDLVAGLGTSQGAEEEQARALALRYRLEYVDLSAFNPDPEILSAVPVDMMFRYNFLPYRKDRGRLVVVMADPTDIPVVDEISLLLGTPVQTAVSTSSAIQECLKRGQGTTRVLEEAGESFKIQVLGEDDKGDEVLTIDRIKADASPIIRLVDTVLFDALSRRASDIHIETQDQEVVIKYRIDGALQRAMKPIAKQHHAAIISRIKVMAELDIAEKRVPQDGRFRVHMQGRKVDFRVSIMPSVHGEDSVIRILDKESLSKQFATLSLDILGYEERELARFRRLIREPYGMILVTGPTGSGKTTALYGALSEIKSEEDKIITIEDPVEYQLRGITQIPVNEKKGLTFARGLRSVLRHDPDTIMVGEIRDKETAEIAINSALTGHLVFTTVHANNVIDVLGRFLNIGIEPYNFVSSLNCILAQRLVRTICGNCKRKVQPSPELLAESGLVADSETWVYEGAGCVECGGTGYKGRTAICELLDLSDRIRELILDRKSSAEIKRAAKEEGMVFMREVAVAKALRGETTLQEINKVTFVEVM